MAYETKTKDSGTRVEDVRNRWKAAKDGNSDWRDEARKDFAFRDGDQWEQDDKNHMMQQKRPALTFNRISTMVESVCGLEVNNRLAVKYFGREVGDAKLNEIYTAAAKWVRDECGAADEESEAFRDAVTCGVGATDTFMDYSQNADGDGKVERIDPLYCFPDPAARKAGYCDARYLFKAEWMDREEIEAKWPEAEIVWTDDALPEGNSPHASDREFFYEQDTQGDQETLVNKALVLQYQCYELEPVVRFQDPQTNKVVEVDMDRFEKLKKAAEKNGFKFVKPSKKNEGDMNQIAYIERKKRVYYKGYYVGDVELEFERSPLQEGFTIKFITARRDRNRRMFYGIVRPLRDPQQWANKWLSQLLQIIASNSKGGAFIEENALKDPTKAEEQWGSNDSPLIMLQEGGIGKIQERQQANYPSGIDRLMTFAFESMPFISGINLEALGLANREQANALEETRRKAAIAILAPLFDSLSRYRREQGHLLLFFIREYLADGRLIRITGQQDTQEYIQLVKEREPIRYDVVVGETPDSPDFKKKVWQDLQPLLSVLLKTGKPIPAEVLQYSSLPVDVSKILQQAMSANVPNPQQIAQMKKTIQQLQGEIQKRDQAIQQMQADQSTELQKANMRFQENRDKVQGSIQESMIEANVKRYLEEVKQTSQAQSKHLQEQMKIMAQERKEIRQLRQKFAEISANLEGVKYSANVQAAAKVKSARISARAKAQQPKQ